MKKTTLFIRTAALLLAFAVLPLHAVGCSKDQASVASPSDAVSSAEESAVTVDASEAVAVMIDGQKADDVFQLQYNWYGKEYAAEDSLNKIMMDHYAPAGNKAPLAKNGSQITFVFDPSEESPAVVRLTQYANTVRANSGIPFDTVEIELVKDESGALGFNVDFRKFKMYYYMLECEWENGNRLKYAFAVEKTK